MVPALIHDDYVIRFAVCAQNANDDDITYAWRVISEMATDVINACADSNKEREVMKEIERIESLEIEDAVLEEKDEEGAEEKHETEEDEVFLYDDNIPSIPSISPMYDRTRDAAYRRRNMLLRMISDPKCYNPRVLKSLSHEKRHKSDHAQDGQRNSRGSEHRNSDDPALCNGTGTNV